MMWPTVVVSIPFDRSRSCINPNHPMTYEMNIWMMGELHHLTFARGDWDFGSHTFAFQKQQRRYWPRDFSQDFPQGYVIAGGSQWALTVGNGLLLMFYFWHAITVACFSSVASPSISATNFSSCEKNIACRDDPLNQQTSCEEVAFVPLYPGNITFLTIYILVSGSSKQDTHGDNRWCGGHGRWGVETLLGVVVARQALTSGGGS